jgi:hypothetical protein
VTDEKELQYRTLIYRAIGLVQMLEAVKKRLRRYVHHPLLLPNIDVLRLLLDLEAGLGIDLEVRQFIYGLFSDLTVQRHPQYKRQIDALIRETEEGATSLLSGDSK